MQLVAFEIFTLKSISIVASKIFYLHVYLACYTEYNPIYVTLSHLSLLCISLLLMKYNKLC
jgi:hypothetical protein